MTLAGTRYNKQTAHTSWLLPNKEGTYLPCLLDNKNHLLEIQSHILVKKKKRQHSGTQGSIKSTQIKSTQVDTH